MRSFSRVLAILATCLAVVLGQVSAQDDPPLVVFIDQQDLLPASTSDPGPDGLSRLAEFFRSRGARTQLTRADDALPDDADVIVLVRPRAALPVDYLARIWRVVENGANLLIAVDPSGHGGGATDAATSGLSRLLTLDYGITLQDGILLEDWFNPASVQNIDTSYSHGYARLSTHPINLELSRYDLPIFVWGARPLRVEALGAQTRAYPLFEITPRFAETNRDIFRAADPAPFELNIGVDGQGRMTLGAIGGNTRNGTRAAVLGDGEMLLNDYGLALLPGTQTPRHLGNTLLAQRLVDWLLETPYENWYALPDNYTWLQIDGSVSDWSGLLSATADSQADSSIQPLNLQWAGAFQNDAFLYLALATAGQPISTLAIEIGVDNDGDGTEDAAVIISNSGVISQIGERVVFMPDADFHIGTIIEARIPLRAFGRFTQIARLCLTSSIELAFEVTPDCLDTPLPAPAVSQRDPAPLRFSGVPIATVQTADFANIRQGPGTNTPIVGAVDDGDLFALIGRNQAGDWYQIRNARYEGWMASYLMFSNADLERIPIVGAPD